MKKSSKRVVPALLSLAIAATSLPMNTLGMPMIWLASDEKTGMGEENQMVSEKALVYVSSYDGTVRSQDFNGNWKFFLGDAGNAQEVSFDDSRWRSVNLPHDYSIEQEYSSNMEAESGYLPGGTGWYRKNFTVPESAANKQIRVDFDGVYMNAAVYINGKELGSHPYGYSPFSFDLTPYLNFGGDNVIAVKVNHQTPSSRWYSGSGIYRDVKLTITPMVHEALNGTKITTPGLEDSTADATVHMETEIQNESMEEKEVNVSYSVYEKDDGSKTPVATGTAETVKVAGGGTETVTADLTVTSPQLWTLEDPELYVVETTIQSGSDAADVTVSDFGFRYFEFDTSEGFFLNGEPVKLKGVCMHHDQGSLGAAAYKRAIERQVEILQDMGCNAIRVTHNPAARTLIDICNEKGMLVIEELFDGWHGAKNGNSQDYAKWYGTAVESGNQILGKNQESMTWAEFDLRSVIRRDYNAPSIISWSLGNEVMEGIGIGVGEYPAQAKKLIGWACDEDSTRPVTFGDNKLKSNLAQSQQIAESIAEAGGMVGFNYTTLDQMDSYHSSHPDWPIYGSETASSINSRGVYDPSKYDRQLTAYDESKVNWGHLASQAWFDTIRKDYVAGEFVWTGFDYIGEPTNWNGISAGAVGAWPSPKNSYFGIVDTAGLPKDSYYLYRSMWNEEDNTVHILPAWNKEAVAVNEKNEVKVVVYSDAASVELFFTPAGTDEKKSLGEKKFTVLNSKKDDGSDGSYTYQMYLDGSNGENNHQNLYRTWMVPYEDGTLTAVAKDVNGKEITGSGRSSVTTAGKAARLKAEEDRDSIRADGNDLCYVTVQVTDENGNLVPDADNRVSFKVEGDGELVGVDNGWTTDHDSYQSSNRRAFNGKLVAIVRSTREAGEFTLTASSAGLEGSSVTVSTEAVEDSQTVPENGIVSYEISKNYYVKVGNEPAMPNTLTAYLADGSAQELPVAWEEIDPDKLEEEGSFVVSGDMNGTAVTVSVSMLKQVAAILNYSTTVHMGEKPILPEARQIVGSDGTVLNIALPVEWEEKDDSAYDEAGIVTVNGIAEVFGEPMEVTASVRVQEERMEITDNVGTKAKVAQSISEDMTSDTLSAVNNGSAASEEKQDASGRNLSRWSNWKYTKEKDNDPPAELIFTYDTQETLGQAKIYFAENNSDLKKPDAGQTQWFISNDKSEWIPLETKETIADEESSPAVTCYTYDFSPVKATYIKVVVHNSRTAQVSEGRKAATAITEVELYRAEGRFSAGNEVGLSALTLNGVEVGEDMLTGDSYSTPMTVVEDILAEGKENAAVTILPALEDKVIIITEAEDHSSRAQFTINLGADSAIGPDDASMDYPADQMTVDSVSSEEVVGEQAPKENVLDGKTNTFWHNNWKTYDPSDGRWIILELEEETKLEGLRYLPRQDAKNGRVNEYKVEVSTDKIEWKTAASGNWGDDGGWKLAAFEEPAAAKYVRMTGVKTHGDQKDKFITAAEIRVRRARETIDLTDAAEAVLDDEIYIMDEAGNPVKPEVTVTLDGAKLKYGIDYTLAYENNDKPGTGSVTVKGIMKYSGQIRKEFRIVSLISQDITAVNGAVIRIEGEDYTGGSRAQAESGKTVTVQAEERQGQVFDHWRCTPAAVLKNQQLKQEEITFTVPGSSVRLVAVYRDEGMSHVTKDSYSTADPSDWFAYTDEEELGELLDAAMDENDETALARGGSVELKMNIKYSRSAPSKKDILKSYNDRVATDSDAQKATPSEAGRATPSDAKKATGSNAKRATASDADLAVKNPAAILSRDIPAPLLALQDEMGIQEDRELKKATRISFWLRTTTHKITNGGGQPISVQLTDNSLPAAQVVLELPEEDRRMTDYIVYSYEFDGDGFMLTEVSSMAEGKYLTFDAGVDGIYALAYTKCFDVVFEDWDGTVLSRQRIPYAQAAQAPEDPQREGYHFVGWSREFDEVKSDLTIKAKYEKGEAEKPADKTLLKKRVEEILQKLESMDEEDYTEKSWDDLNDALEDAMEIMETEGVSQKEVDKALEKLEKAYTSLKKNQKKPDHSSDGSGSSNSQHKTSNIPVPLDGGKYVTVGVWKENGQKWSFTDADGVQAVSRWIYTLNGDSYDWFYFDEMGNMADGWLTLDDGTFYLNPVSDGKRGRMITGWKQIDGKWYYFNDVSDGFRGKLLKDTKTPDGYQVGEDGVWKP